MKNYRKVFINLLADSKVLTEAEIVAKEMKCYHTRVSFKKDILGIGIVCKYLSKKTHLCSLRSLSSPLGKDNNNNKINYNSQGRILIMLDLLSYTAFNDGVREAVYDFDTKTGRKTTFTHWMPLYINADHASRAKGLMEEWCCKICRVEKFSPNLALTVLPKLMNTTYDFE